MKPVAKHTPAYHESIILILIASFSCRCWFHKCINAMTKSVLYPNLITKRIFLGYSTLYPKPVYDINWTWIRTSDPNKSVHILFRQGFVVNFVICPDAFQMSEAWPLRWKCKLFQQHHCYFVRRKWVASEPLIWHFQRSNLLMTVLV